MYFKSAITHAQTDDKGHRKLVREQYVVQAEDWADAQTRLYTELADARKDFAVKAISPIPLHDLIFSDEADVEDFYLCQVVFSTETDRGKQKKFSNTMLVNARSVADAHERINDHLKAYLIPHEVKKVDKTKILEVFLNQPETVEE